MIMACRSQHGKLVLRMFSLVLIANSCGALTVAGQTFEKVLPALVQRWRWETYWGQGIAKASFKPFVKRSMELYSTRAVTGFCLPHLNYCASYESNGTKLGRLLVKGRCGAVLQGRKCVEAFIQDNEPASLNWKGKDVSIAVEDIDVPSLETVSPSATPAVWAYIERLKKWLGNELFVEKVADRTVIIPYISEHDPEIYVLMEVPSPGLSAVLLVRAGLDGQSFENAGEIVSIWPRFPEYRNRILRIEAWRGALP